MVQLDTDREYDFFVRADFLTGNEKLVEPKRLSGRRRCLGGGDGVSAGGAPGTASSSGAADSCPTDDTDRAIKARSASSVRLQLIVDSPN